MADRVSKEVRSRIMSKIKGKNTSLELMVFGALRRRHVYFRKHYRPARGCPDLALPGFRIAVFIDGDFWHGWRYPTWRHKLPSDFWQAKIERNRARDRRNFAALRRRGWKVLRVWEHDLRRDPDLAISRIVRFIRRHRPDSPALATALPAAGCPVHLPPRPSLTGRCRLAACL